MAGPGQIFNRAFFWAYERGTWQYDLAVGLILVFVLATPRGWFHDQPQVGVSPTAPGGVMLLKDDGVNKTFSVDARVLAPPEQTPLLENELHNALQRSVPDLRNARFTIVKIDAQRDEKGNVIAYHVDIHH
jgi:hypothetical protein